MEKEFEKLFWGKWKSIFMGTKKIIQTYWKPLRPWNCIDGE